MRNTLTALAVVLVLSTHAEAVKVLGFTMNAPAPKTATVEREGAGYRFLSSGHGWCPKLYGYEDQDGVFAVVCHGSRIKPY